MIDGFQYTAMTMTGVFHLVIGVLCFIISMVGFSTIVYAHNITSAVACTVSLWIIIVGLFGILAGIKSNTELQTRRMKITYMVLTIFSACLFSIGGIAAFSKQAMYTKIEIDLENNIQLKKNVQSIIDENIKNDVHLENDVQSISDKIWTNYKIWNHYIGWNYDKSWNYDMYVDYDIHVMIDKILTIYKKLPNYIYSNNAIQSIIDKVWTNYMHLKKNKHLKINKVWTNYMHLKKNQVSFPYESYYPLFCIGAFAMSAEFILAIVSSSICCCCSEKKNNVVLFHQSQAIEFMTSSNNTSNTPNTDPPNMANPYMPQELTERK